MEVDEVSAFQTFTEEQIREAEDKKAEAARIKKQSDAQRKMRCYGIDFEGASLYFKMLKDVYEKENDPDKYNEEIVTLIEVINHEFSQNVGNQQLQLMYTRGLLMLVHNDQFADYDAHDVSAEIIKNFLEVTESSTAEDKRDIKDLQSHDLIVQFLAALPTPVLHQYVMQLQSLMTMNIVAGGVPNYELIVVCVRMLDIFFWINQTFRDPID